MIVGLCATALVARAQSVDAETMFTEGNKLMADGKIAEACDAFEASNRFEPRAGTLIRLGECREQNHQLASAWSAYKDALTRVKDPKKKDLATKKVQTLETQLSYLTVSVPDEARVDGLALTRNGKPFDPALWNRAIPVDGGAITIGGRAPGHEEWRTTVEVPAEAGKITVDVPKFKELGKLAPPPTGDGRPAIVKPAETKGGDDDEDEGRRRPAAPGMFTSGRKAAVAIAAIGAIGIATGAVFGLKANDLEKQADMTCPAAACTDMHALQLNHDAQSDATIANVAIGIGGAAIIGAVVLWFVSAPAHHESLAIAPVVRGDQVGLSLVGGF